MFLPFKKIFKKGLLLTLSLVLFASFALAQTDEPNVLENYNKLYNLPSNGMVRPLGRFFKANGSRSLKGDIHYIAILVEFPDYPTYKLDSETALEAQKMIAFKGGKVIGPDGEKNITTMKDYFKTNTYGKLNVEMQYFPRQNDDVTVKAYVSKKNRKYYMPKTATNTEGYTKDQQVQRETELLTEVLNAVKPDIERVLHATDLDSNKDGYVDSVNFFLTGPDLLDTVKDARGDLLWSHKADNYLPVKIEGLSVAQYNILNAGNPNSPGTIFSTKKESDGTIKLNRSNYSVIMHEFTHTLGLADLYRTTLGDPVDYYDIMANNHPYMPQPVLAYFSHDVLGFADKIPTLEPNQKIKLYKAQYTNTGEVVAAKINSKLNDKEHFYLQYYDKPDTTVKVGSRSGLLIYRTKDGVWGNLEGGPSSPEKDQVFVFRPNETANGAGKGDIANAPLAKTVGNSWGKSLDESSGTWDKDTLYFSDGRNSGIKVKITAVGDDFIEVEYDAPTANGSGTKEDPYLIATPQEWINFVQEGKHVKLVDDLDFTGLNYTPKDLNAIVVDGNDHTIKNLSVNGSGLFEALTDSEVKDLNLENITVNAQGNTHAGALAGSINGTTKVTNVKALSGSVSSTANTGYTIPGTGGLVGTIANNSVIDHSLASLNVSGHVNVGGLVGLAQGGTIKNSTAASVVKGLDASAKVGEFYGSPLVFTGLPTTNATYQNNLYVVKQGTATENPSGDNAIVNGILGLKPVDPLTLNIADGKAKQMETAVLSDVSLKNNVEVLADGPTAVKNGSVAGVDADGTGITALSAGNTTILAKLQLQNGTPYSFEWGLTITDTRPQFTVTYEIENGTWKDGNATAIEETVPQGEMPLSVPTGMQAKPSFNNGHWKENPQQSITANKTFTYTFDAVVEPTITAPALASNVSNDVTITPTSTDTTRIEFTFVDPDGTNIALATQKSGDGSWVLAQAFPNVSVDPNTGVITLLDAATKNGTTITAAAKNDQGQMATSEAFTAPGPLPQQFTITFVVQNGSWEDGSKNNIVKTKEQGTTLDDEPTNMVPDVGYTGGEWDEEPFGATVTANKTYTYAFTAIPTPPTEDPKTYFKVDPVQYGEDEANKLQKIKDAISSINPNVSITAYSIQKVDGINASEAPTTVGNHSVVVTVTYSNNGTMNGIQLTVPVEVIAVMPPVETPTPTPSETPTATPEVTPSEPQTPTPSAVPTATPSVTPSIAPTLQPQPSATPNSTPTLQPIKAPKTGDNENLALVALLLVLSLLGFTLALPKRSR